MIMEQFFNTAIPQAPNAYTIDPLSRFDINDLLTLIRPKRCLVLHALRQTGKTSCMLALRDYLNQQDGYIAVYTNVEGGLGSRNNVDSVVKSTKGTETDLGVYRYGCSVDEGHLIIFGCTKEKSWEEHLWNKPYSYNGLSIMAWGM